MANSVYLGKGEIISAYATEDTTAGDIVNSSSGDDLMTMAASSYAASDILVEPAAAAGDPALVVGVALTTAGSGSSLSVITEGLFIVSGNNVTAGNQVAVSGAGQGVMDTTTGSVCGRALTGTTAADAKFLVANLDFS